MARTTPIRARGAGLPVSRRLLALAGDDSLVAEIRAGNEAGFDVVYERYGGPLLSFCRHLLGSREEAEDAVQQTFAAAHGDLLRSSREVSLRPWLYTIARNRCLSMLRARREEAAESVDVPTAGLDDRVEERADLRQLLVDLRELPERQRAALLLSELRDLSHAQVAEVLGCETGQVKAIVFRARSALIERRDARKADCSEIRAELETARRGALRRGRLRHHLRACPGCAEYLEQVRHQRKMLALLLPVAPTAGLKPAVLGGAVIATGSATGGALAGGLAGSLTAATLAKLAAVGVVAAGIGLAGERALDHPDRAAAPAQAPGRAPYPASTVPPGRRVTPGSGDRRSTSSGAARDHHGRRGRAPHAPGKRRDAVPGSSGRGPAQRSSRAHPRTQTPARRRPTAAPGKAGKNSRQAPGASRSPNSALGAPSAGRSAPAGTRSGERKSR